MSAHTSEAVLLYQEHLRTFDCRARSRRSPRNGARICAGGRRRYGSCNRNTSVHVSSSSARPCPSGGPWPAWISSFQRFAFFDRLVVLVRIVLLGRRHNRRIDHLPAPGEIALFPQEPIKQIELPLQEISRKKAILANLTSSNILAPAR